MEDPDDYGEGDDETNEEEKKMLLDHCIRHLNLPDFVMEPQIVGVLQTFFRCGGDPETVVNLLSENYCSLGQLCNLIGDWLADLEGSRATVDECFESALSSLIAKHFQPELADKIFEAEGVGIEWLPELISHKPWRRLIYSLAEQYPHCLMLNFAVKLISDAGFQHEISNVNTAAQQAKVVLFTIDAVFHEHRRGPMTEAYENALAELVRVVCHSEHTYLYTQALLHVMCEEETGMPSAACAHISQVLRMEAHDREQDTSALHIALKQSHEEQITLNLLQAMHTMMSKQCLNPADISQLYQQYVSSNPPPVELIREHFFVDMLIDSLFAYEGIKVHIDHRSKYVYLLAYASSVGEQKTATGRVQNRQELNMTKDSIERIISLLEKTDDLMKEMKSLLCAIRLPVIAAGLLYYLRGNLLSDELISEPEPVHFVLLDQIATTHPNLQLKVFRVLCELYDRQSMMNEAAEVIMEKQRSIVDRFVHLLSVGLALPVVEKINKMFRDGQIDISLVRYFATEVLEIVAPPYSDDFIGVFLPIVSNSEILDQNISDKIPAAKEFINHCTPLASETRSS
ncbi:Negative elongation factor D [Dirofilaria immitis]|nr:Negative elongation factor D [Dirofilaria immitis]